MVCVFHVCVCVFVCVYVYVCVCMCASMPCCLTLSVYLLMTVLLYTQHSRVPLLIPTVDVLSCVCVCVCVFLYASPMHQTLGDIMFA